MSHHKAVAGSVVFLLLSIISPRAGAQTPYTQSATETSASSMAFVFTSNTGAAWVDLQVRKNGGGIVGYRMTPVGGGRHEVSLTGLLSGDSLNWQYLYQDSSQGQVSTGFLWTHVFSGAPRPTATATSRPRATVTATARPRARATATVRPRARARATSTRINPGSDLDSRLGVKHGQVRSQTAWVARQNWIVVDHPQRY
jgi:hypothetical protein